MFQPLCQCSWPKVSTPWPKVSTLGKMHRNFGPKNRFRTKKRLDFSYEFPFFARKIIVRLLSSKYFLRPVWSLGLIVSLFLVSCQEPAEVIVPKGDDGQVFAIDTEQSELPYLVIDTQGKEIPYEPGTAAKMKIYQQKKLIQEQLIDLEYRGKTSFRLSDKKGFNFETIDASGEGIDVSFFGLPVEEDWRLIGHVVNLKEKYVWDQSLIYNHAVSYTHLTLPTNREV